MFSAINLIEFNLLIEEVIPVTLQQIARIPILMVLSPIAVTIINSKTLPLKRFPIFHTRARVHPFGMDIFSSVLLKFNAPHVRVSCFIVTYHVLSLFSLDHSLLIMAEGLQFNTKRSRVEQK